MNKKLLEMRRKMLVEKSKYLSDYTIYGNTVVEDGVIKGVGDEVKWNQFVPDFKTSWITNRASVVYNEDKTIATLTHNGVSTSAGYLLYVPLYSIIGHKYIFCLTAQSFGGNNTASFGGGSAQTLTFCEDEGMIRKSLFIPSMQRRDRLFVYADIGTSIVTKEINIFDLTEMGVADSINTIEDFKLYLVSIGKMKSAEDDIPYFPYDAGSVFYKMPIVASGKNLFDYSQCDFIKSGGESTTEFINNGFVNKVRVGDYGYYSISSDFIVNKLKPNTRYTFSYKLRIEQVEERAFPSGQGSMHCSIYLQSTPTYDGSSNKIVLFTPKPYHTSASEYNTDYYFSGTFTTPSDMSMMKYLVIRVGIADYYFTDLQIEEGSIATEYKPYHEPEVYPVSLSKPLYKINDITDYASYSERGVWRNCDIINGQLVQLENPIFEPVDLPKITKFDGLQLTTDTEVKPSNITWR